MHGQRAELAAVEPVVADVVARYGFELEEFEVARAGKRHQLRVLIDSDDGVGADDIATVSRALSKRLDRADEVLTESYTLEVSSPGLERPLTRPRHWRRNRLRRVRARYRDGTEIVGRVGDCDDEAVTMLVSGVLRRVPLAQLDRAVVEVEFSTPPTDELAALGDAPHAAQGRGRW